jgi:hypothetical protein
MEPALPNMLSRRFIFIAKIDLVFAPPTRRNCATLGIGRRRRLDLTGYFFESTCRANRMVTPAQHRRDRFRPWNTSVVNKIDRNLFSQP